MSIDARVVGLRAIGLECKLTLVDRPGGGPAGQGTLLVDNPPKDLTELASIIGCDIWGGSGDIMLGDKKFADRLGYLPISLVDNWREVLGEYERPTH